MGLPPGASQDRVGFSWTSMGKGMQGRKIIRSRPHRPAHATVGATARVSTRIASFASFTSLGRASRRARSRSCQPPYLWLVGCIETSTAPAGPHREVSPEQAPGQLSRVSTGLRTTRYVIKQRLNSTTPPPSRYRATRTPPCQRSGVSFRLASAPADASLPSQEPRSRSGCFEPRIDVQATDKLEPGDPMLEPPIFASTRAGHWSRPACRGSTRAHAKPRTGEAIHYTRKRRAHHTCSHDQLGSGGEAMPLLVQQPRP